jgi:hypothetical protein
LPLDVNRTPVRPIVAATGFLGICRWKTHPPLLELDQWCRLSCGFDRCPVVSPRGLAGRVKREVGAEDHLPTPTRTRRRDGLVPIVGTGGPLNQRHCPTRNGWDGKASGHTPNPEPEDLPVECRCVSSRTGTPRARPVLTSPRTDSAPGFTQPQGLYISIP